MLNKLEDLMRYFNIKWAVKMLRSRRLGNIVEVITTFTGIKYVVKKIWGDDCGCDSRKEKLNKYKLW